VAAREQPDAASSAHPWRRKNSVDTSSALRPEEALRPSITRIAGQESPRQP